MKELKKIAVNGNRELQHYMYGAVNGIVILRDKNVTSTGDMQHNAGAILLVLSCGYKHGTYWVSANTVIDNTYVHMTSVCLVHGNV
jgi:hypothetical protein